jgi:hypothetical protein
MKQPKRPLGLMKPKKLPAKRVMQIADSLDRESGFKIGSALQKFDEMSETEKKGKDWLGRTPEESKKAANRLWDEGLKDKSNASRYRSLVIKAMKKK